MLNVEVAKDSKSIAAAAKRDSSAMKSIALLTMLFLPATFVSVSETHLYMFVCLPLIPADLYRLFSPCLSLNGMPKMSLRLRPPTHGSTWPSLFHLPLLSSRSGSFGHGSVAFCGTETIEMLWRAFINLGKDRVFYPKVYEFILGQKHRLSFLDYFQ